MIEILSTIQTKNTNPFKNLALEEYLLTKVKENECILYLWQNKNTVVIGKNQNCWKECKVRELEDGGGHMVRRLSGGGAVYHDIGNLNFTFLVSKENYDLNRQLNVIIKALEQFNIPAVKSGRNDITVYDKKVSGNAFYKTERAYYHHGTLLVNVDLDNLSRYLMVSADKMKSHGVDSVRLRVANLSEFNHGITIEELSNALVSAFEEVYQGSSTPLNPQEFDLEVIQSLEDKFSSWEWRFGRPITFQNEFIKRFSWGELQIQLSVVSGIIKDAVAFTDAMETEFIPHAVSTMIGASYDATALCDCIMALPTEDSNTNTIKQDICSLIKECIQ